MTEPLERREQAEELYIIDGLTLEQTAERTDIPVQTLKRWSSDNEWFQQRKKYRSELTGIKQNTVKLVKALTENALTTLDPQTIFAIARLKPAIEKQRKQEVREADIDRPKLFLEDIEFIAQYLQENDPEGLKILARNFEVIVNLFKESHEKTT